jgi:hypothetical protein
MRLSRLSVIVALVALIGFVAVPLAQGGLDGNWALTFDTPMGSLDASATFKTDGDALTGTLASQMGSTEFKGTVKGTSFSFTMNVPSPDGSGDIPVQINGEVDGDAIKGTFDFGQGSGTWSGKRAN